VHRERAPRIYLCLVAAALVLLAVDTAFITHQAALLSGVWLLLLTLPWTPVLWAVLDSVSGINTVEATYGWDGYVLAVAAMLISALINAVLLGLFSRYRQRQRERRREQAQAQDRGVVRP
jgi:hypothetical protein